MAGALGLAHAPRRLEAVDHGHARIHQDHGEILAQHRFQRLLAGIGDHDAQAGRLQEFPHRHQALGVVVDHQNARLRHCCQPHPHVCGRCCPKSPLSTASVVTRLQSTNHYTRAPIGDSNFGRR
jgi:hypothetical protein